MVTNDIADKPLFEPAQKGLNRLLIVCGYVSPNMDFSTRPTVKQDG